MQKIMVDISSVRPSQLYINQEKIESLIKTFNPLDIRNNAPLPVKCYGDEIFFTDGHTRAFLYYLYEVNNIPVYWDEDQINLDLYKVCLKWCKENKIMYIGDLENRVVSDKSYNELWIQKCEELAVDLAKKNDDYS